MTDLSETAILGKAQRVVYERPNIHGKPEDSFHKIAGMWNAYLGNQDPMLDGKDVCNMMMLLKIARNSEGVYHEDNYVDLAGYAENGARLNNE